ncbi:hypothetical protein PoB_004604200 [Plakobranchus ocellatus]|uniref:Uncharacterized protein n=1 Tax=Plakobranchus ocellatus TaxID=259542 RepID=A0AAV4BJM2_9GAST|nr:hypothetical protein PoB_004604200 [Plakobranchus ocellatus]
MENLGHAEVTKPSVSTSETVPTPTQENYFTLNSMLDLLKDDVYTSLADHFLRTNRGRKPKLPDIPTLTNGVLLQLNLIKDEGQSSFQEVRFFFHHLLIWSFMYHWMQHKLIRLNFNSKSAIQRQRF